MDPNAAGNARTRHALDSPVTVQVFFSHQYIDVWQVTIKIVAVTIDETTSCGWTLEHSLAAIDKLRDARETVYGNPAENPVLGALRQIAPNRVGGINLTPSCSGVRLEVETVPSPVPVLLLQYS